MSLGKIFSTGVIRENPVLFQLIGMCPILAVTTSIVNGVGMGVAVIFVLTFSNLLVSTLRKVIPTNIRIPCFIIIIASFVTIVDLVMQAYAPELSKSLGLFIPLIVVNCVILARAEAFAFRNPVLPSVVDGLGMGIGFTFALVLLASIREFLGTGAILAGFAPYVGQDIAVQIIPVDYAALVMIMPPGAFITLGFLIAIFKKFASQK
jgi:electron transport complex protein RnfE